MNKDIQSQITALQQTMRRHTHDGNETAFIASSTTTIPGTVTNVAVLAANGITGSVSNPTTTPAITLTLGNITPTSIVASGQIVTSGQIISTEYDNGNITGTATIDWSKGNTQYATLTGDTTLTFSNQQSGGHYILELAGAHTTTFPGVVRWNGAGSAPAQTLIAGRKDIYGFIYSGKENLYDGQQVANYFTT